eukprot:TRINITY_DN40724_c0_g1_i1.p1 TRINITY_DN40724_c0_g1~~TRINITY_DN40724_c0_g1_i1.p1  ORF type:complete len:726 (+),score=76.72 TRINITY_DN40724_c0_g1_i1:26-2203(+)
MAPQVRPFFSCGGNGVQRRLLRPSVRGENGCSGAFSVASRESGLDRSQKHYQGPQPLGDFTVPLTPDCGGGRVSPHAATAPGLSVSRSSHLKTQSRGGQSPPCGGTRPTFSPRSRSQGSPPAIPSGGSSGSASSGKKAFQRRRPAALQDCVLPAGPSEPTLVASATAHPQAVQVVHRVSSPRKFVPSVQPAPPPPQQVILPQERVTAIGQARPLYNQLPDHVRQRSNDGQVNSHKEQTPVVCATTWPLHSQRQQQPTRQGSTEALPAAVGPQIRRLLPTTASRQQIPLATSPVPSAPPSPNSIANSPERHYRMDDAGTVADSSFNSISIISSPPISERDLRSCCGGADGAAMSMRTFMSAATLIPPQPQTQVQQRLRSGPSLVPPRRLSGHRPESNEVVPTITTNTSPATQLRAAVPTTSRQGFGHSRLASGVTMAPPTFSSQQLTQQGHRSAAQLSSRPYVADSSDPIDMAVSRCVQSFYANDPAAARRLRIVRVQTGIYEIGGRHVSITQRNADLVALEHGQVQEMALSTYLAQPASGISMSQSATSLAKSPERRVTFGPSGTTVTQNQASHTLNHVFMKSPPQTEHRTLTPIGLGFDSTAYLPPTTPVRPATHMQPAFNLGSPGIVRGLRPLAQPVIHEGEGFISPPRPDMRIPPPAPPASTPFIPWLMAPGGGSHQGSPPRKPVSSHGSQCSNNSMQKSPPRMSRSPSPTPYTTANLLVRL